MRLLLATSVASAAVLFAVVAARPALAGTRMQGRFVSAPTRLDGGADKLPAPAGDGHNDTVNMPADSSCPLPGIGSCTADPNIACSLEAGFSYPGFAGMLYLTCSAELELGLPMELKNGAGTVKVDLAQAPLGVCLPRGNTTQLVGAAIHAPSGDVSGNAARQARIGFFRGSGSTSAHGIPCPSTTLPLRGSVAGTGFYTGLPIQTGVGPVIGVLGGSSR